MSENQSTVTYRNILAFPGYRAGSDGTIWSCRSRNGRGPLKSSWRQLIPRVKTRGYHDVLIYFRDQENKPTRVLRTVHSLVLEAFVGARPSGLFACHRDDDPSNNNSYNLYWGTPLDNAEDAIRNGRQLRGEQGGNARLTLTQVRAIRSEYLVGASYRTLAVKYGVSRSTIARIITAETWWCDCPNAPTRKPPKLTAQQVRQSAFQSQTSIPGQLSPSSC